MFRTILLLTISNCFMTYAWYGHLKNLRESPLWIAILTSWGVALFEYCFQVPGNRIGANYFSVAQLKVMQEIITMLIFAGFAFFYLQAPLNRNFFYASLCLVGAAYFMFRPAAG